MDHIDILLSKLGYSELVQRLFEKMTFFLMAPLSISDDMAKMQRGCGDTKAGAGCGP